jgi:DNA-binding transcriptional ArsR family regulator
VGGAEGPGAVDERASPDAVDEVLAALAAERRRIALSVLCEAGELEPAELAERVAQREVGVRDAADSEIASVRASLRHQHLPTLDNAGLVDRAEADETGNDETVVDETDAERETISFDGRAAFDAEWLRIADEARADVSARVRACDCGAFEGCEDLYVVSSTDGLGVEGAVRLRNDGSDDAGESR